MIIIDMVQSFLQKQVTGKNLKKIIDQLLLFVPNGAKDIRLAYKSKYNGKLEKK